MTPEQYKTASTLLENRAALVTNLEVLEKIIANNANRDYVIGIYGQGSLANISPTGFVGVILTNALIEMCEVTRERIADIDKQFKEL